jgi:hypothetical protein
MKSTGAGKLILDMVLSRYPGMTQQMASTMKLIAFQSELKDHIKGENEFRKRCRYFNNKTTNPTEKQSVSICLQVQVTQWDLLNVYLCLNNKRLP